ncbi:carbohydrate ABC transporter permease [Algihabitans sp.]|uniref:carbohydrate ABC transporter permease n=1 Tax=Algihabitans sp. TaxID=2821514 RepID=UPI003BA97891
MTLAVSKPHAGGLRIPSGLRDGLSAWSLALPATLAMLCLIFVPTLLVAILSLTDWQFGARSFTWIGLENFTEILRDDNGRKAVTNTLIYVGVVMPTSVALGLLAALGVQACGVGRGLFRAAVFLPVASTLVAMATVWQMLLHPSLGLINTFLAAVDLSGPDWLSDRNLVLFTLAGIGVWETVGYNMVLFLAGLAAIPEDLYQAAEVDGAGKPWERFWTVTWPLLGPTILFVVTITAIRSFRVFETVATLTAGGPGYASDVLVYAFYREGFEYFRAGYSAALTVVFLVFTVSLTLVKFRLLDRWVFYR